MDQFNWCKFESEDWLICEYGGNANFDFAIQGMSRLVAIKVDGSRINPLGRLEGATNRIYRHDGAILDWLPAEDHKVLMGRNGVEEVDIVTLKSKSTEPGSQQVNFYMSDGDGELRVRGFSAYSGNYQLTGVTRFSYRAVGGSVWKEFLKYNSKDNSGGWPVAVDKGRNAVFILEALDGRDALYTIALDGTGTKTLLASNKKVDIDSIVRLGRGRRAIGYSYAEDRRRTVFFDPEYEKLAAALAKAMPKTPLVEFASASRDEKKILLHASADTDPGTFYLLDRATHAMRPVFLSRDPLEGRQLSPVEAVTYRAADGTTIPAYVTASLSASKGARPAVVLPHGGPSARDEWGFDWLAQFLAARGYVVIQPNYRGSAGYGADHLGKNAFKNWRQAMSDIDDAASFLVSSGKADPERLAIVGWSYGGYAALQSANLYPGRYKSVVAIAPVTDLLKLKTDARGYTDSILTSDYIGKGENVRAGSPLANADRIKVPVMLVHGDMDNNVLIHHSDDMAKALKSAGTSVDYLRFDGLEHDLDDSNARIQMLTRIGQLLDRTIGS